MHQCNYCCWYNERYGNCDCPYVMKKSACDKAKKEKERSEYTYAVAYLIT